jgi:hypothetical protein
VEWQLASVGQNSMEALEISTAAKLALATLPAVAFVLVMRGYGTLAECSLQKKAELAGSKHRHPTNANYKAG